MAAAPPAAPVATSAKIALTISVDASTKISIATAAHTVSITAAAEVAVAAAPNVSISNAIRGADISATGLAMSI
ncbi:MAG: hypothetical protein ACT4QC_00135 [Planctomycetaceae bacterium]